MICTPLRIFYRINIIWQETGAVWQEFGVIFIWQENGAVWQKVVQ